ncbi:ubiquinone biosynthesis O-methyltransferase [Hesseltinella vesiculosa]|uniref:Ubiquinone biosynthesis O-methyltransferase, mitochondrial n=1 Tax=Hesseltinella vesiculosa TaxID=101127 RepID=A0A1X2GIS3_9FUNG|nr:ubiquinone biosynthesis O-methyltransferase [Hesseltinella vesiculosa]
MSIRSIGSLTLRSLSHTPRLRHYSSSQGFTTIDAAEVKKFSAISDEWWEPHGAFGMLQLLNPPRVAYVRDRLGKSDTSLPFQHLKMLDIGCGGGLLSESLVRLGGQVVGADASENNIKMAKLHARKDPQLWRGPGSLDYRHTTAEDLLAAKEQFDVVMAMEIIEHVNQPLQFLQTCGQLTRPGGSLFLSTMSRTPLAYALTVFLAEKVFGMVHDGTHDWSKYIKTQELTDAIESFGDEWHVKDIRGIAWDPLGRRWQVSERNGHVGLFGLESLEVNYIMQAVKKDC